MGIYYREILCHDSIAGALKIQDIVVTVNVLKGQSSMSQCVCSSVSCLAMRLRARHWLDNVLTKSCRM